ncbi:MAG: (deoxy)nucleoside triphosphate pyrophosphohydrolase [Akkermansiaceae bacterium]|nr:(deoxy)nucleoside triphosphate pyrophosphohydrolase [Akkermansiaceae bacterium]
MINVVCAVIQDRQGRVLVCRRPDGKALAGKWEFPGGKIEPDEPAGSALQREIAEELGCEVEVGRRLDEVIWHYPAFSIRLMPYLCKIRAGEPVALEHREIRWVGLEQCPSLDWAEADVPVWSSMCR